MLRQPLDELIPNQPIVIDNGSGMLKAGFAGDEKPKLDIPAFVGRPKHQRVMAGAVEGNIFVGSRAESLRGLLTLRYPMSHGIVTDWIDMEAVWAHAFAELKANSEEHPVLLTEAPLNPRRNREKTAEVFFETFNSPALFVSPQAILALYANGRTTGVVLDVGDGVSHAIPVYEGFALSHGIMRSDVAGREVTDNLWRHLRRAGYIFNTSAEMEIVRQIKETACYVSTNSPKEGIQDVESTTSSYPFTLPDGTTIYLGSERHLPGEVLFNPSFIGHESPGAHELLVTAIQRVDMDLRRNLYAQIVLSGGSTLFPGFGDRLLKEIARIAPRDTKIRISAPPDRKYSTWLGGSILASLATFKKMWITKQEYQEDGSSMLHKKTF